MNHLVRLPDWMEADMIMITLAVNLLSHTKTSAYKRVLVLMARAASSVVCLHEACNKVA